MSGSFVSLSVGQPYPFAVPHQAGAVADFLRPGGNRLLIALGGISGKEVRAMRKGPLQAGLLCKNGAMLLLWQFRDQGKPVLTLDTPFDVRRIPDLSLPDVVSEETRLLVDLHIVDTDSGLIRGLRSLSMPPDMTRDFLAAVQSQIVSSEPGDKQLETWMTFEPEVLLEQASCWYMGG